MKLRPPYRLSFASQPHSPWKNCLSQNWSLATATKVGDRCSMALALKPECTLESFRSSKKKYCGLGPTPRVFDLMRNGASAAVFLNAGGDSNRQQTTAVGKNEKKYIKWKQPKYPSTNEWINKVLCLGTTEQPSAMKGNGVLARASDTLR